MCGSAEHEVVFDLGPSPNPLSVPGAIARCRRCPMWFKVLTDPARVSEAYSDAYAENEGTDDYMAGPAARAFFRRVLRQLGGVDPSARPTLLDVGAGQGALIEEAEALGYDTLGIDRCEPLARRARAKGLRVECTSADDLEGAGRFDVVTMMDVIEHVPDPRRLLAAARRLLKPLGRLVVYTPNHRGAVVMLAKALHASAPASRCARSSAATTSASSTIARCRARCRPRRSPSTRCSCFPTIRRVRAGRCRGRALPPSPPSNGSGKPFNRTFRMLALATKGPQ